MAIGDIVRPNQAIGDIVRPNQAIGDVIKAQKCKIRTIFPVWPALAPHSLLNALVGVALSWVYGCVTVMR